MNDIEIAKSIELDKITEVAEKFGRVGGRRFYSISTRSE